MKTMTSILAVLLCLLSVASGQTSVAGKWVTTDFNEGRPNIIELKADGASVTGTISREGVNAPNNIEVVNIFDGKVDGNTVTFKARTANGDRTITYTGAVKGDQISFKRSVDVRPGGAATGAGIYGAQGPMQFVARRNDRATIVPDPFLGNWQLNIQKSKYEPGPAPQLRVPEVRQHGTRANGFFAVAAIVVNAQGAPNFQLVTAKDDGKEYPVHTANTLSTFMIDGTASPNTVSSKLIDPATRELTFRTAGRVVSVRTATVSQDGKTLTETAKSFNEKGQQTATNVLVFEKQ